MRFRSILPGLLTVSLAGPASAQENVFSLDGLIVTASPTPRSAESVASHVTVLEGEELRARGVTSVPEALRSVAGLHVVRNGSFGAVTSVFLRGGESDYALVLVDGVQVNQPGGGFDYASLTTDNVERIEIVRGPASALYGSDGVAGVIHLITRSGEGPPRASITVETASYSEPRDEVLDGVRWSADMTGGTQRLGYSASLSRNTTDGILDFNNRYENTVLSGTVRFRPDDATRVALALRLADREFHFPTGSSGQVVDRNAFTFGDESLAHLSASRSVSDLLELALSLGWSETDGGFDDAPDDATDTDGFHSLDHFHRATAELRANLSLGNAVVTAGAEIEEERQRSFTEFLSAFGPSYGRSESDRLNRAVFVHAVHEQGRLAFNAGGRVEDNERFGTDATWQLGFSAHLPDLEATRLRASAGSAIKEPTFFENFATGFAVGNPHLDPERSLSWEVGLEHDLGDAASVQATYFDQRFEDLIQFTLAPPTPGDPNYFNVAEAHARGIELGAEVQVGIVQAGTAYTWLDTEVTDSGFDTGPDAAFVAGETLLRRPRHSVAIRASSTLNARARVHTRVTVVGSRADRSFDAVTFAPSREELQGYGLWSLGAVWDIVPEATPGPAVSLSLRGENLLDKSYDETWGFAAPGRQLYLGVSVNFGGGG